MLRRRQKMSEKPALTALEKFKLVALCTDEFSDEEVEDVFLDSKIENVEEIIEMVDILGTHRPNLFKKITSRILGIPQTA